MTGNTFEERDPKVSTIAGRDLKVSTIAGRDLNVNEKMIQEVFKAIQLDLSDEFSELKKLAQPGDWKEEVLNALKSMRPRGYVLLLLGSIILFLVSFPDWLFLDAIKNAVFWADLTVLILVFLLLFSLKIREDNRPLSKKELDWLKRELRRAGELAQNPNQEEQVQSIYNDVSNFLKSKKNNKLTDEGRALIKSAFLSVLVRSYAISGKWKRTLEFYNELSECREQFPSKKPILVAWTLASPLIPPFYATNNQIEEARKIYDGLVILNPVYSKDKRFLKSLIEKARKIYNDLVNLNFVCSEDKRFLKSLRVASANMIVVYEQAQNLKEARAIYEKLVELTGEYLGKQKWIRCIVNKRLVRYVRKLAGGTGLREKKLFLAVGCVSMIVVYKRAGQVEEAREVYDKLADLLEQYPKDKEIQALWAQGSFNMAAAYALARRVEEAREVYDKFEGLASKHHKNKEAQVLWAEGSVNMIGAYALAKRVKEAEKVYKKLEDLASKHPEDKEVWEALAEGSFNMITVYGEEQDLEKARGIYDGLKTRSEQPPEYKGVREALAKASVNMMGAYITEALAVLEKYAKASVNMMAAYIQALEQNLKEARGVYGGLVVLASKHPEDKEVRKELAQGSFNMITAYGQAKEVKEARRIYARLEVLSKQHFEDKEVREALANSSFNMILAYILAPEIQAPEQNLEEAREIYARLEGLSEQHSEDKEVWGALAEGSFSMIGAYAYAKQMEEARGLYGGLEALSKQHPEDKKVWEALARASVNMIGAYIRGPNLEEARGGLC